MVHPVELSSTSSRVDLSLQKSSLMVLIYLKAFQFLKLTFIPDSRDIESREQLVKSVGWQIVYIISFKKETIFFFKINSKSVDHNSTLMALSHCNLMTLVHKWP